MENIIIISLGNFTVFEHTMQPRNLTSLKVRWNFWRIFVCCASLVRTATATGNALLRVPPSDVIMFVRKCRTRLFMFPRNRGRGVGTRKEVTARKNARNPTEFLSHVDQKKNYPYLLFCKCTEWAKRHTLGCGKFLIVCPYAKRVHFLANLCIDEVTRYRSTHIS